MSELTLLVDTGGVTASELRVIWHDRLAPMDDQARARVEERWSTYLAEAPEGALFDGAITWLVQAGKKNGGIVLDLAPASYKDFLVTVLRDRAWFRKNAPQAMRPGLGNSALLTHGQQTLLGIRSQRVTSYRQRVHPLGGVLDGLANSQDKSPTIADVVAHLRRELSEEAAVRPEDLRGEPHLLAVFRDEFLAQPELAWQWETAIDLRQIAHRLDAQEHSGWLLLDRDCVAPETWTRMTPVARGAWERWSAMTGASP